MTRCFIGLGANLGNSHRALRQAAQDLQQFAHQGRVERSSIYASAPVGPPGQADYLNAVVALHTSLDPLSLLDRLQSLEEQAGRVRGLHWGPRTLDLDLLLYGTMALESERLTLPHPRIYERNFVLIPLADIVGEQWVFEDGSTLSQRIDACPHNEIQKTDLCWSAEQPQAVSA